MIDSHIHIGQFYNDYYDFNRIFDIVLNAEVDKIIYSSTTSCIKNIKYDQIYKEIESALALFSNNIAIPLLWYVPGYINQGIKIDIEMKELKYGGFKLHPLANFWDFENNIKHMQILHEIFDYANNRNMLIKIHTGESGVDRPNRFDKFISEYRNVKIILAHCRPVDETVRMMRKYPNVFGDTAFATSERIAYVKNAGFGERLVFGTDFPITYYYYKKNGLGLKNQYYKDLEAIKLIRPASTFEGI